MKKILNSPYDYAQETLDGLCLAFPQYYRFAKDSQRVIVRSAPRKPGKVGIVSGGGSGHLPVFTGYVGMGFIDACAVGDVFASPSAENMAIAMREADAGAGVLRLYGNYGGDTMNFDMAGDFAEMEGIASTSVRLTDDVASADEPNRHKRRGVAGMVYAFKLAGAAAEAGLDLDGVTKLAQRAADACRSIGVALTPCTVPQVGKPTFSVAENDMEIGMGIHGEPGVHRGPLQPANQIADTMMDHLLANASLGRGSRVSVLVNSLGATPVEELLILYPRIHARLADAGVSIVRPLVGRYATSMEMTGASVTLIQLDSELERYLAAPAECAFWRV